MSNYNTFKFEDNESMYESAIIINDRNIDRQKPPSMLFLKVVFAIS